MTTLDACYVDRKQCDSAREKQSSAAHFCVTRRVVHRTCMIYVVCFIVYAICVCMCVFRPRYHCSSPSEPTANASISTMSVLPPAPPLNRQGLGAMCSCVVWSAALLTSSNPNVCVCVSGIYQRSEELAHRARRNPTWLLAESRDKGGESRDSIIAQMMMMMIFAGR